MVGCREVRPTLVLLSSFILTISFCGLSTGQWDCFNRRTWSYYGTWNWSCVLTGSTLDCQYCENWSSIIGNWSNADELIEGYDLEENHCRIAGNFTSPWCYIINLNGEVKPGYCRIPPCSAQAGCRNGTGADYHGYAHYTESGYNCSNWEDATDTTLYPQSGLEENFCRNPDGRDRPWCYYQSPESNEILSDFCQIDECTSDALSYFEQIPNARFDSYDDRVFVDPNITSEECAQKCLQEESFSCLSFKFRDIHTYNDHRCTLSAQSIHTLDLARTLPNKELYHQDHDMFTRIDKICDAFLPDFTLLPGVWNISVISFTRLLTDCPLPLNTLLNNGRLNASFSASSYLDGHHPSQTNVESARTWIPQKNATGEWWQVCYGERVLIIGFVTRGNKEMVDGEGCWVNSFKVDYSLDGTNWWNLLDYQDATLRPMELFANAEATCNTTLFLPTPLRARCLRILPVTWRNKICLSLTILGCLDNDCDETLGLNLGRIHDNQIEASSWNGDALHPPSSARLGYIIHVGYGWIPAQSSTDEWIQINFNSEKIVQGVVTQGCLDIEAWVESYTISYSHEVVPYRHDNGSVVEFGGNWDTTTLIRNDLDPPVVTPLVRVHPVTWYQDICLRIEFIGCHNRVCNNRLGMESFEIPNEAIEASSFYYKSPGYNGRLHAETADLSPDQPVPFWGARGQLARNEWLQVDLGELHTVTGIITQGAGLQSENDWVNSYRLAFWSMHSTNVSETWLFYKDIEGSEMIFPANNDHNTEVRNILDRPIVTRRVRIMPYEWHRRRIRMRAEIVGCRLLGTGRVCGFDNGLQFGGRCYGSVSSTANNSCSDIFAEESKRATIKSSSIQNELSDHLSDLVFEVKTQLTIGATREGEDDWLWDDGTPVIYEQFPFEMQVDMSSLCAALDGLSRFQWTQYECSSVVLRGTLCEIDIDECLRSDNGCSHECVNDDGGYHCACPTGYRLDSSRRECLDMCATDIMNPTNSTVLNEGSSCFYVMDSEEVTWTEAANQCTAIQGHLPNASDLAFMQALEMLVYIDEIWTAGGFSNVSDLCPFVTMNTTEIIIGSDHCDEQKLFICEKEYSILRSHDNWSDGITSHVALASVGLLQAYSYPPWYNERSTLGFLISGLKNMNVRLNIIQVKLRQDPVTLKCLDALNIHDIKHAQYCGDLHDIEVISQTNVVNIELTMWSLTADMPSELGFEAIYDMVDCTVIDCNAVCGERVSYFGPSGSFETKDYPSVIPPFTNCAYNITVQSDRYISLHFNEFDIERERDSTKCVDHVSVRSPTGILQRNLCGNSTQPLIISNTSTIIVALDTGLSGKSTGFSLVYNTTELGGCGFGRDTCLGVEYCDLSAAVFVSVNYPFPYAPNSQCRWSITTPEGSFVTITFIQFDVASDISDHDCAKSDYLVVYGGTYDAESSLPILGRFCNANPPSNDIRSSLNAVVIEFVSDNDLEGDGFYAEYRATYTELDGDSTTEDSIGYTCPEGWELYRNKCYQFTSLNQTIRWNDASKICRDVGAFLVSIKTADEMNFIHYMLTSSWFTGNDMKTYIGLTDTAEEGVFRWEDGGPLSYADWYIDDRSGEHVDNSQPNGHDQEDCTMIKLENLQSSANWHDIACASREASQFICDRHAHSEENVVVTSRIGDLSTKECPTGSRRIGDICISLTLVEGNKTSLLPCQPIQSSIILPLPRLQYVLSLLWPFQSIPIGTSLDLQGVYELNDQTLNPLSEDVTTEYCHVMEYNGDDWQLVYRDCALGHDGSICYSVVSDLVNICGDDMFECMNGECIRSVHVCDGRAECTDGEDEVNCRGPEIIDDFDTSPSCPASSFQCDMGRCISASFYCDFILHCQDMTDEINCVYPECKEDEFQCTNGQCIDAFRQCDITQDCVDGSDEELCQFCSGDTFQCYDGTCIPDRSVCDGSQDCRGLSKEDEQLCVYSSEDGTSRCLNGEKLDSRWRCLYDFDQYGLQQGCRDVTHLRNCDYVECFGNTFKCPNSYCLPLRRRCDGVADCPDGEDEFECESYSCPGFLRCHGERYCVTDDQICDGVKDCTDGDDEMFCDIACPSGCTCDSLSLTCHSIDVWTPDLAASISTHTRRLMIANVSHSGRSRRAADISLNQTTIEDVLYLSLRPFILLMSLELPGNGIEIIVPGTFTNQQNLKKLDLSRNNIWMLYTDTFLGLNRLTQLDLSLNPLVVLQAGAFNHLTSLPFLALQNLEIAALEPGTFVGLDAVEVLNLADNNIERVESGAFTGLNYTRTLNLEGNDITTFQLDIFRGLDGLQHLSSDLFLFCCIRSNLMSCSPPEDQFSSCEDLMRSNVLRIFMWILGFSAFIGNIFVIIERARDTKKFRVQSFLIFNLAISDCLMGVYMLIIASADAHFRNVYVFHAESWKASGMCKLAGILANLSSEVSVLILAAISIDRFLCIAFPFSQRHLGRKSVRITAGVIWAVCLIYSVIPALPFPYFGKRFYGRSGVCLALPLTNDKPPAWEYAMSAIFINFVAMVIIICCYLVIYVIAKRSGAAVRSSKQMATEMKLAVRTAVIVATDIFCWLPIVILAFVSLTNSAFIPPTVYAWIAVFVLPINSSINPYIYTISTIDVKTRLASFRTGSSFFSGSNSSGRNGTVGTHVQGGNVNRLSKTSSGERDSSRSIPMNEWKTERFILSEALALIRARKLRLEVDDVQSIRKDLNDVLKMIHACAMTHGSIDADHIIMEKEEESGKWTGSVILKSTHYAINDGTNGSCPANDDLDKLEAVITELNDALGHGTVV